MPSYLDKIYYWNILLCQHSHIPYTFAKLSNIVNISTMVASSSFSGRGGSREMKGDACVFVWYVVRNQQLTQHEWKVFIIIRKKRTIEKSEGMVSCRRLIRRGRRVNRQTSHAYLFVQYVHGSLMLENGYWDDLFDNLDFLTLISSITRKLRKTCVYGKLWLQ